MSDSSTARPTPTTIHPVAPLALALPALALSVAIRGPRRSLRLLGVSVVIATAGEALAIRGTRVLRHHSQPQLAEVPLIIPLLWYVYAAQSYALAQAAVGEEGPGMVSLVTALLATATDLANDPSGLASGLWEWRDGGRYMQDVVGTNGMAGIPVGNYIGWLVITGAVAWLTERDRPSTEVSNARGLRTPLLLAYWLLGLGGLRWAGT